MSKYKSSLPEDIDITDPRDTGLLPHELPSRQAPKPDDMDMAVTNLIHAINDIKHQPLDRLISYLDYLGEARDNLNKIIDSVVL